MKISQMVTTLLGVQYILEKKTTVHNLEARRGRTTILRAALHNTHFYKLHEDSMNSG